jgi:hypothetical protein
MNPKRLPPQELFDHLGGEIASLNPNDLRRRTQVLGQVHEIAIGADHGGKLGVPGPIEDVRIGCSHEIVFVHALESGKDVGQLPNQLRGEILVQQDAHGLAVAVGHVGHLRRKCVHSREVLFL